MNVFIKLHYDGEPMYFNVKNINAFYQCTDSTTHIYMSGDQDTFTVDESAEYIANRLKEAF